jgi:hypothetical protein
MPTSELTGLGDQFSSQRLQLGLSIFETVPCIMCIPTTMRILLTLRLFARGRDGLHVDLRSENPTSSKKVSICYNYPWLSVRSVPYDHGTGNYSDPRVLPTVNLMSNSDLDAGVDMGEAGLILYDAILC